MAMTLRLEPQDEQARAERAFDDALADTLARYPETIRRLGE